MRSGPARTARPACQGGVGIRGRRLLGLRRATRFGYFIYGCYPIDERWRVDIFFVLLAVGVVWLLWLDAPRRDLGAIYFFVVFPIVVLLSC